MNASNHSINMRAVTFSVIAFCAVGIFPVDAQPHHQAKNSATRTDNVGFVDPEPSTGWKYGTLIVTNPTTVHLDSGDIAIPEKTRLRLWGGSANKVIVSYKNKIFTVPFTFTCDVKRKRYLSELGITPEHPVRWIAQNGMTYDPPSSPRGKAWRMPQ